MIRKKTTAAMSWRWPGSPMNEFRRFRRYFSLTTGLKRPVLLAFPPRMPQRRFRQRYGPRRKFFYLKNSWFEPVWPGSLGHQVELLSRLREGASPASALKAAPISLWSTSPGMGWSGPNNEPTDMKDLDHIEPTLRLKTAIASCRFFSMLTEREAAGLAAAIALRQFGKGETIYREADPADKAWLALAGTVKLLKAGREVRPLLVEIMVPQDMFGAVCHSGRRLFPTAAITTEDCLLLALPCEALEKVLGSNAWFQRTLLADFCQRLCHAQQMRSLAHQAAFCRIAGVLEYLHSKFRARHPAHTPDPG